MSGFTINVDELRAIQAAVGATESQFIAAYNKALKQTAAKLYRQSAQLMMQVTGAKGQDMRKRRVRYFVSKMAKGKSGGGKIWFGLNDVPVSFLKGTMKGPRKIKRRRDERGRFIKAKGARGATFTPKGMGLYPTSFPDSFVATIKNKRSIWVRNSSGFINEARMSIAEPMTSAIGSGIFPDAGNILLDYFMKDLRGRVAGGIQ